MTTTPLFSLRSRAFTLVELLTVIAIIGVLAGILIPVVRHAREQSRQAACTANIRQYGVAASLYAQEHKGRLPYPLNNTIAGSSPINNWAGLLYPYVTGAGEATSWNHIRQMLAPDSVGCPSNDPTESGPSQPWFSYKMNYYLGENLGGTTGVLGRPVQTINNPAKVVFLADGRVPGQGANPEFWYATVASATSGTNGSRALGYPHQGRANLFFVDGHVGTITPDEAQERWTELSRP